MIRLTSQQVAARLQDDKIVSDIFLVSREDVQTDTFLAASDRLVNSNLSELSFIPEYAERGITNLMVCCSRGYISILSTNLFSISNINKQDASGKTALHYLFSSLNTLFLPEMFELLYFKGSDPLIEDNEGINVFEQVYRINPKALQNIPIFSEWFRYNKFKDLKGTLFSTIPRDMVSIISTLIYLSKVEFNSFLYAMKFYDRQLRSDPNYMLYIISYCKITNKNLFTTFAYLGMLDQFKISTKRYIDLNGIDKFKELYAYGNKVDPQYHSDLLFIAIYNEDIELINYLFSLYDLGFNILKYVLPKESIVSDYYRKVNIYHNIDFITAAVIRNNNKIFDLCINQNVNIRGTRPLIRSHLLLFIAVCNSNVDILEKLINMFQDASFHDTPIPDITSFTPNAPYYKKHYDYFTSFNSLIQCIAYGLFDTDIHKVSDIRIIAKIESLLPFFMSQVFLTKNDLVMARDTTLNQFLISPLKNIDGKRFARIHNMKQFVSYNIPEIQNLYLLKYSILPSQ